MIKGEHSFEQLESKLFKADIIFSWCFPRCAICTRFGEALAKLNFLCFKGLYKVGIISAKFTPTILFYCQDCSTRNPYFSCNLDVNRSCKKKSVLNFRSVLDCYVCLDFLRSLYAVPRRESLLKVPKQHPLIYEKLSEGFRHNQTNFLWNAVVVLGVMSCCYKTAATIPLLFNALRRLPPLFCINLSHSEVKLIQKAGELYVFKSLFCSVLLLLFPFQQGKRSEGAQLHKEIRHSVPRW